MNGQTVPIWLIAAGAGGGALTGFANLNQLQELNIAAREEVRVAEIRGQMQTDISTVIRDVIKIREDLNNFMLREGVIGLHETQQRIIDDQRKLIDKLIDWTGQVEERYATKHELSLLKKALKE